jgi:glycine/D-amino acid oxidase-like deaminating enzyme
MKDFIIVGGGIAGISFAETAILNGHSVMMITDGSQMSSVVAAGLYNPVVLKRLNLTQDAAAHLEYIDPFYSRIQEKLRIKIDYKLPVYRKFASVEEQNLWFEAADKPGLSPFLSTAIVHREYPCLPSPYGFGEVLHTGYIHTSALVEHYQKYLQGNDAFRNETFEYSALKIFDGHVSYKGLMASHIVFAEGYGLKNNPFFNTLPLNGTKGELLVIKAPELKLDIAVKGGVFILPMGGDLYKIGATYEWDDKTNEPTEAARIALAEELERIITCDYEIVGQAAGIRPTTKDRKPLIGTHPEYKNVHLLNGLGTRGVMLGPPMAKELYEAIRDIKSIRREVSLSRFINQ